MVTRNSEDTILETCKVMSDWRISSIAITTDQQSQRIIGILTERDIVAAIAKGMNPEKTVVASLMSTPVLSIRNDLPIEEGARMMIKNNVRHLLIEDNHNNVIGIITTTDLARYLKEKVQKGTPKDQQSALQLVSEAWELFF